MSGLAYGIDICAHRTVLRERGITTAVLGHGLDRIYPASHRSKAQQMLEQGGLLTEYPSGTDPDAPHFPARNRIVAGICKGVIVIEAGKTGGALITAKMAFDQHREVYALPGRIGDSRSIGCNHLIRDQIAKLITDPQEVLDDLEIQWQPDTSSSQTPPQPTLELFPQENFTSQETKILNVLAKGETVIDQLTYLTQIPIPQLNPLLLSMEFKGLIRQTPGKKFRIC